MIKAIIKKIYQYKITLLFFVLWAHVSMLNLFYVDYTGPVFLWEKNTQLLTILIHMAIAGLTTGVYLAICKIRSLIGIKTSSSD